MAPQAALSLVAWVFWGYGCLWDMCDIAMFLKIKRQQWATYLWAELVSFGWTHWWVNYSLKLLWFGRCPFWTMFLVWWATTKQKRRRWLGRSHFVHSIRKCHCCCRILGSFIWGSEVMDTRVQALSEFFLFVRCRVGGIITMMIWQAIQPRDTYCEVCGPFAFQYLIMFNHVTSREIREAGK